MNDNAKKWVETLLSGRYAQAKGTLCKKTPDGRGYCCLGVACDLYALDTGKGRWIPRTNSEVGFLTDADEADYGIEASQNDSLPDEVLDWLGMATADGAFGSVGDSLAAVNDEIGSSFQDVVEAIREHEDELFVPDPS